MLLLQWISTGSGQADKLIDDGMTVQYITLWTSTFLELSR